MAKKPDPTSRIADNKKAAFNYFFEERHEAGMVLYGWEVKALREGKVQLTDGYVLIREGELYLLGCLINPLKTASTHVNPEAARTKKLLLKKDDIKHLIVKVEQKGYTLVPLNLHWKNGYVKCEIALAKGKAEHDKRDTIKDREGAAPLLLQSCALRERGTPPVQRGGTCTAAWVCEQRPGQAPPAGEAHLFRCRTALEGHRG